MGFIEQNFSFLKICALFLFLTALYVGYTLFPSILSFFSFISKILMPFFLAFIFYYLLRPLVRFLEKKLNIYVSISIAYLFLAFVFSIIIFFISPFVVKEFLLLENEFTQNIIRLEEKKSLFHRFNLYFSDEIHELFLYSIKSVKSQIFNSLVYFISTLTELIVSFAISIFILFYLLKDDHRLYQKMIRSTPTKYQVFMETLFTDLDIGLKSFINGRVIVSFIISTILFISFLLIGLDYAFLLSLIAFLFIIIPTVGSFLSMIFPLLFAFSKSIFTGIEVFIIMLIAASIEGFIVTPQVMGKTLYVHPLTILFVLLIGGSLFGVFGLLFSTPTYIVLKTITLHVFGLFRKKTSLSS